MTFELTLAQVLFREWMRSLSPVPASPTSEMPVILESIGCSAGRDEMEYCCIHIAWWRFAKGCPVIGVDGPEVFCRVYSAEHLSLADWPSLETPRGIIAHDRSWPCGVPHARALLCHFLTGDDVSTDVHYWAARHGVVSELSVKSKPCVGPFPIPDDEQVSLLMGLPTSDR